MPLTVKKKVIYTHSSRPDGHYKHSDDTPPKRSNEQQRDEDTAWHRKTVGPRRQQVVDDTQYYHWQKVPFIYHSSVHRDKYDNAISTSVHEEAAVLELAGDVDHEVIGQIAIRNGAERETAAHIGIMYTG